MANLKEQIAKRITDLIGDRKIVGLGEKDGPSLSYIYRMKKGQNVSIEQLDALVRAYGSNLGEFFAPWRENAITERLRKAAEIREMITQILASDLDLTGLYELCRGIVYSQLTPPAGVSRKPRKRSSQRK